jgi:outer membrane immunogenic protein
LLRNYHIIHSGYEVNAKEGPPEATLNPSCVASIMGGSVMKYSLFAAIAALAFAGSSALAADLPTKAPVYKAPPAYFSWTGFYIGANAGYGWAASNDSVTYANPSKAVPGAVGPGSARGGFGGGQIGYNSQINSVVLGVEADFQGAGLSHSTPTQVIGVDSFAATQKINWFYTVRGRAGFAFDRALLYFTGGFAGARVVDTALVDGTDPLSGRTSRTGYVLGGGLEWAFHRDWSAKIEYQFINVGQQHLFDPQRFVFTQSAIKDQFNTVRFGINYHFGNARY